MTTQGVGIVFKHDFDKLFKFFHKRKRNNKAQKDSLNTKHTSVKDTITAK